MAAMLKSAGEIREEQEDFASELELNGSTKKSKGGASSRRTKEADDEFAQFAEDSTKPVTAKKTSTTLASSMDIDSDEEETTTLQTEFADIKEPPKEEVSTKSKTRVVKEDDGEDIDDLAMAVKSKATKKKSKKSKK
jgi:hypothetical protein